MYRCELCKTSLLERNKIKHNQSKKRKYYSTLILNRYVIKNVDVIKFKDVFNPYFTAHTRKIKFFTVQISLRLGEGESPRDQKTNVSNYVTYNIQT